jgi:putative ABC transport system permease protein
MGFGIALISLLINTNSQIQEQFRNNLGGVDLVVGAKGSPLQIILSSIFHIDFPTGNIKESDVEWLNKNRLVKSTIPISLGDSYRGFRIVGCTESYSAIYSANTSQGQFFKKEMQVVLGYDVAKNTGLKVADQFIGNHGMEENDIITHEEIPFTVTGILSETGLVIDKLILTSNESVRLVHHEESDSSENEITALLIEFRNPMGIIQLPRMINSRSNLQAASPSFEAARIFSLLDQALDIIKYIGVGIMTMAGLSIFISLFIALRERQYELALLRTFGAGKSYIFLSIILEALLLSISGYILGIVLSHLGLFAYPYFAEDLNSYQIKPMYWVKEEFYLFIFAIGIATLAAILPAIRAYKIDISETILNAKY